MRAVMVAGVVMTGLTASLLGGCAPIRDSYAERPQETYGAVQGRISTLTRQALPPDTVIEVRLIDTTADNDATAIVGTTTTETSRGMPYPFTVSYRRAALVDGHSYALDASIREDGVLRFYARQPVTVSATPAPPTQTGDVILRAQPR